MPKSGDYQYGCLMLQLDAPWIQKFGNKIVKENQLYAEEGYGREDEPHVTILYGFHDDKLDRNKMKQMLPLTTDFNVQLTGLNVFQNEDYDVLVFRVQDDLLNQTNDLMTGAFEYTTDFPNYNPHATLAYLQKGQAYEIMKSLSAPYNQSAYIDVSNPGIKFKKPITVNPRCYKYSSPSTEPELFVKKGIKI